MIRLVVLFFILLSISMYSFAELTNNPLIGGGIEVQPAYDGSRNEVAYPVPLIRYFGQHWFIRDTQEILEGGLRQELLPGLFIGAQLAYEPGRLTYQSNLLQQHQIPGIAPSASVGGHIEWDTQWGPMPINLLLRDRQRMGPVSGTLIDARLTAGILDYHHLGLALYSQSTWANHTYNQDFYGVNTPLANQSGLSNYTPGSGLLFNSFGLMGGYSFNSHWALFSSVENRRMTSLVTQSPLVDAGSVRYINLSLIYQYP